MCDCPVSRRGLLRATTAGLGAGLGAASLSAPLVPAGAAQPGDTETLVRSGRFEATRAGDWHYVPVHVPAGVRSIHVAYTYNRTPTLPGGLYGNTLDIGIFDPHGLGAEGFRGWSGGAREEFRIGRGGATPGYLPGPVDAGTWHVQLGPYSVAPEGLDWTVTVTLTHGPPEPPYRPAVAPRRTDGTGPGWYRGDLHTHTIHSDGRATPAQLLEDARAAGLDFVVSTEHNNQSASLQWGRHDTDLLVIDGEEVTTRSGHWIAAGIPAGAWVDWRYRAADGALAAHLRQVHDLGGLAIVAHPHAPFSGTRWEFGYDGIDAVELMNGPWTGDDQVTVDWWHARLVAGRFLPAVASSDTHGRTPGLPQTVVHADDLSVGAILDGVRRGRAWLAESAGIELSMDAGGVGRWAGIGERIDAARPGDVVRLQVSGVPGCVAALRCDALVLGTAVADAAGRIEVSAPIPVGAGTFVRAEVRRPSAGVPLDPTTGTPGGPVVALTNPIFF